MSLTPATSPSLLAQRLGLLVRWTLLILVSLGLFVVIFLVFSGLQEAANIRATPLPALLAAAALDASILHRGLGLPAKRPWTEAWVFSTLLGAWAMTKWAPWVVSIYFNRPTVEINALAFVVIGPLALLPVLIPQWLLLRQRVYDARIWLFAWVALFWLAQWILGHFVLRSFTGFLSPH